MGQADFIAIRGWSGHGYGSFDEAIGRAGWTVRLPEDTTLEPFPRFADLRVFGRNLGGPRIGQSSAARPMVGFRQVVDYEGFDVRAQVAFTPDAPDDGLVRSLGAVWKSRVLAGFERSDAVSNADAAEILEGLSAWAARPHNPDAPMPSLFAGVPQSALAGLAKRARPGVIDEARRIAEVYRASPNKPREIYGRAQRIISGLNELAVRGVAVSPPDDRTVRNYHYQLP